MTEQVTEQLENQYAGIVNHVLWDDLAALDPKEVADRSGATLSFDPKGAPAHSLPFLGAVYEVRQGDRSILPPEGTPQPGYQAAIVMLSYLVNAANGPAPGLSGVEVAPREIPSGDLFFKGPHELMKAPVAEAYADRPLALLEAASSIGAVPTGRLSFSLHALPYVGLYCYMDPGDSEFPPQIRYNFDSNIHYYLQLDGIFAMVNCLGTLLVALAKGAC
ncbi:MAG: DUF3786 domain-containing protein [Deltaproteobacteria bacterium]|jgi:hypothetical protein|nr:DUF3786 domain-containing protein [Deltaproteobacteria bacterium]